MRRSLIALVPLLALACDREPVAPDVPDSIIAPEFSATSEWTEGIYEMDWPWYAPCVDDDIHWTGSVTFREHVVTRPDGSVWVNGKINYDDSRFTGEKTGLWLAVAGTYNRYGGEDPAPSGNWVMGTRLTLENQQTGAVMDVPAKVHLVLTGNGSVKDIHLVWLLTVCTLR
jgi:hypothetical protein